MQHLNLQNKIWEYRFSSIIVTNNTLQYYFNLTYTLSASLDHLSKDSYTNHIAILAKKIECIPVYPSSEFINIHNLLLVNLLSNVVNVLNTFSPLAFAQMPNVKDFEVLSL